MEESKVFFSEEKKQKTFGWLSRTLPVSRRQGATVFWFFFSKKNCLPCLALLAGCSSADPTYYTLNAVPGNALAGPALSVEVRRPGLAGYLDRSDVVLKSAAYKLDVNSQIRWAEPLGDMIGRVLSEDLGQRLPGSSVFSESGAISAAPDVRVEVDVQRFDQDGTGAVVLQAEVAVERGVTHQPLATRHVMVSAQPGGVGATALAASLSALLGELADQVAGDVRGSLVAGR